MNSPHKRILIISLLLFSALLIAACGGSEPTATPTLPPPEPTLVPGPIEPSVPTEIDDWERISNAGRIMVGTSADYPPFAFYDANFRMDGYDIALMKEIGNLLDLEVFFSDYAFDGLGGALMLGEIDTSIAAISVTPQRQEFVDFSNIYYVGEDAFLASEDTSINRIESARDLSGLSLAVERGTVYERWAEDELVATGIIPAENLFAYPQIQQAVRDLRSGQVELVMMDLLPAENIVATGGVKIIGQGLNRQRFAIAVPKGSAALQAILNRALAELQARGVVAELASKYLDLGSGEVAPVPTPEPEATPQPAATATPAPVPTPGCIDGAAYVADLNFDDNDMKNPPVLNPGQAFSKGWRLRNSGTCPWTSQYRIVYVSGNVPAAQMNGQPTAVNGQVAPGADYDMYVNLIAPTAPGIYQGFWQMQNAAGVGFGQRVYVGIQVPAPTPPPVVPTPTPSASVRFWTDRTNIRQGECTVNHWETQNVSAVFYYQQGQDWRNYGVAGVGNSTECPAQTTTYLLRVEKRDGTVETPSITIFVEFVQTAPVISQFSVSPAQIAFGDCVNIVWNVQGTVNVVRLSRNGVGLWDSAPLNGSLPDCPPSGGLFNYLLEASGPGGLSRAEADVSVGPQPR